MIYSKIPFSCVKEEVKSMLPTTTFNDWNLIPDDLSKLAKSAGIELQWNKIDWWTSFEYGHIDISTDIFFDVLFEQVIPTNTKAIVVTDECFEDKSAYYLDFNDLKEFVETIYPDLHQIDFFQPNDLLFIFPENKQLVILHHEGYILQFQRPK